jgi:periplasmic divalent cation tolerance protein
VGVSEDRALQVFCTIDSETKGRELARSLVEERLSACVQVVGPIHSTYRWSGAVETATEWLLLIKTTESRFEALRDRISASHSYDVPEIVAVPIDAGLPAYVEWIASSTR